MLQSQCNGDRRAPGMTENDGAWDMQLLQRFENQLRLRVGSPDGLSRTVAVAVAGSIEDHHAVLLRRQLYQAAGYKILDHAAVAMQQYQWVPRAFLQ